MVNNHPLANRAYSKSFMLPSSLLPKNSSATVLRQGKIYNPKPSLVDGISPRVKVPPAPLHLPSHHLLNCGHTLVLSDRPLHLRPKREQKVPGKFGWERLGQLIKAVFHESFNWTNLLRSCLGRIELEEQTFGNHGKLRYNIGVPVFEQYEYDQIQNI